MSDNTWSMGYTDDKTKSLALSLMFISSLISCNLCSNGKNSYQYKLSSNTCLLCSCTTFVSIMAWQYTKHVKRFGMTFNNFNIFLHIANSKIWDMSTRSTSHYLWLHSVRCHALRMPYFGWIQQVCLQQGYHILRGKIPDQGSGYFSWQQTSATQHSSVCYYN